MSNKFRRNMTLMIIVNEQACFVLRFFLDDRIENAYQPFESKSIWGSSLLTSIEMPIQIQSHFWDPRQCHLFLFENNEWQDRFSIFANTFHHTYPFLSTRLRFISCLWVFIDDYIWSLKNADWKSGFIHVVDILNLNILFIDCLFKFIKPSIQILLCDILDACCFNCMRTCCL